MPTAKSDLVKCLDELQATLRPALKEIGFRTRGRAFNRMNSDGLTEVMQIQMGSFDPPGMTYVPGLRENLYGKFTVNLGVFVPEVGEHYRRRTSKQFVQEYHCCIRTRLPVLGPERSDVWWDIRADEALAEELLLRLGRDAIPFFEKFGTRDAILDQLSAVSRSRCAMTPPRIVCAIILAERGRGEDARTLLATQINESQSSSGHQAFVRRLAEQLGLDGLEP